LVSSKNQPLVTFLGEMDRGEGNLRGSCQSANRIALRKPSARTQLSGLGGSVYTDRSVTADGTVDVDGVVYWDETV
jgi:hypothetical protein